MKHSIRCFVKKVVTARCLKKWLTTIRLGDGLEIYNVKPEPKPKIVTRDEDNN